MLRITDKMGIMLAEQDLFRNQSTIALREREATSGSRINQASDDPAGTAHLLRLEAQIQINEQCQSNISRAEGELNTADQALETVSELLIRAREVGLAMANGTVSDEERSQAAEEIQGIRQQIISLANTKHDGIYIFGGYLTDQPPLDNAGILQGDTNVRRILAGPDQVMATSVSAAEAFTATGGRDILADLDALSQALASNDISAVSDGAIVLAQGQKQVITARARVGILTTQLQMVQSSRSNSALQLQEDRSRVADADAVKTLSELVQARQALNYAIQVSSQMLSKLSLVDKL